MKRQKISHIIGIDEVGRGPIAGPVTIGIVLFEKRYVRKLTKWGNGFRDSKKLTPKMREEWFQKIEIAQEQGLLRYAVVSSSSKMIDQKGIVYALRHAIGKALTLIEHEPMSTKVLLDGGLRVPLQYAFQETIIKGDEKELIIALASIVAKVTRDRNMVTLSKKFPHYDFEKHKGYGTRAHYDAIKKHGISEHHRKSFLGGVVK